MREMMEEKQKDEKIISVSNYIKILNQGLREFTGKIIGEVSEVKFGPSGHVYFSLKDEGDKSVISCIIWRYKYQLYGIELREGLKIIASGHPEIYAPTGRISFLAEVIEHAGEGELKKEYERLKKKLSEEGLFAEEKKRKIPAYIQRIGMITSLNGAVIADFSNNLGKFGFKVKMIDSRVEGQTAAAEILSSIRTFKKQNIEALVIMRGGGSLESMLAFNNELLVREVANFPVPVIVAIGHHKDVPLMALVADIAVSTPSIATTMLTESWKQASLLLERHERNIISKYSDFIFEKYKKIENGLKISLGNFKNALLNVRIGLGSSLDKSLAGFSSLLLRTSQQLTQAEKIIGLNDPERQLMLGYSITRCNNKIVRSIKNVKIGEGIDVQVSDGKINSQIINIAKQQVVSIKQQG